MALSALSSRLSTVYQISQTCKHWLQTPLKAWLRSLRCQTTVGRKLLWIYYSLKGVRQKVSGCDNHIEISQGETFTTLKNVDFIVQGNDNHIFIEEGTKLENLKINVSGSHHRLSIGKQCLIQGGCLWLSDDHGWLSIGEDTTIVSANIGVSESHKGIRIGQDCMLAHGIEIRCGDSHSIFDKTTGSRLNPGKSIEIGDHVWIGAHVRILKGVHIGCQSVIGMGSVVTHSIPKNSIAVGTPAVVKRQNINWLRENLF